MKWPFHDPENTAVIVSTRILEGNDWVYYVTHDADDGVWQFHPYTGPTQEKDAKVVSLKTMIEIEPRLTELADTSFGLARMARYERRHMAD